MMRADDDYSERPEEPQDLCPECEALDTEPHHPQCRLSPDLEVAIKEANWLWLVGRQADAKALIQRAKAATKDAA